MGCISPFDNGSYHMGTIRTNRMNRQLGEGFLGLQRVRNILSPPNEMQFSIRQRLVSHGHDSYESTATAQLFYDSYLFRCIGQPSFQTAKEIPYAVDNAKSSLVLVVAPVTRSKHVKRVCLYVYVQNWTVNISG